MTEEQSQKVSKMLDELMTYCLENKISCLGAVDHIHFGQGPTRGIRTVFGIILKGMTDAFDKKYVVDAFQDGMEFMASYELRKKETNL